MGSVHCDMSYFTVCGEPIVEVEDPEGGKEEPASKTSIENHPWMVSIGYWKNTVTWEHGCGGSVITSK